MNGVVGRVIIFALAGFAAGLLTWFISDVSGFVRLSSNVSALSPAELGQYYIVFCTWGAMIGVMLGIADTVMSGGRAEWGKVLGMGLGVGLLAGPIGGALGMAIFGPIYKFPADNPVTFLTNVLGRALGWALIGALAGTADGWRKWSLAVGRNGFIGGLIGGLIGGMTFEIIPYLIPGMPNPGVLTRLVGFVITGTMIGLFVALVQELLKEAWLKVMVGRNEGKEILIYRTDTYLGRSELSDVPLYGDTDVAKTHAVIKASSNGFVLSDISQSQAGVYVNGQRIPGDRALRSGDQIQIASKTIVFYERLTRTPTAVEKRDTVISRPASANTLPSLADLPGANASVPPAPMAPPVTTSPLAPAATPAPVRRTQHGNTMAGQLITKGARLVVIAGPYTGSTFPLRSGAAIGRNPENDIALPADTKASRVHARLVAEGSGLAIEDNNSTNGTFVNGQRITRQALVSGDTIVIGTTTLRLE